MAMNTHQDISTLFLDIGGVLLSNSWDQQCRRLAAETFALDLKELNERHHLTFDTFEEGKIDLDCYLDRVIFYVERKFTRQQFKQFMFDQSKAIPEMLSFMKNLKKEYGLRIAAVSNDAKELVSHRVTTFELKTLVDFFVCSCFVHCRKPDEDIFRIAMDIAQVTPKQVVYVDDRRMFVEVAHSLGIQGVHHTDFASTRAAFTRLGLATKAAA